MNLWIVFVEFFFTMGIEHFFYYILFICMKIYMGMKGLWIFLEAFWEVLLKIWFGFQGIVENEDKLY